MSERTFHILPGRSSTSPILYMPGFPQECEDTAARLQAAQPPSPDCTLVFCCGLDWNRDLSPWPAPPLREGEEEGAFSGHAGDFLQWMQDMVLPAAEQGRSPAWRGIAGYSLAGLFSIWTLFQTDLFSRAASVSGSLWYPGFADWALQAACPKAPDRVYFSLGNREDRTRHPILSQTGIHTEAIQQKFRTMGAETIFERNPGGHFTDPPGRIARGLLWLLDPHPSAGSVQ